MALENGITLCYRCHFFKKDQDPKAYLEFIEDWLLRKRDMSYEELEEKYKNKVIKWTLDDWLVALEDLRVGCI